MAECTYSERDLYAEAERIYETIQDERLDLPGGETGWTGYDVMDGNPVLKGENGLYSGQVGIAVYLAAMYDTFGEDRYRRETCESVRFLLDADVEELTDHTRNMGSIGSLIHGLSIISSLTGKKRYQQRAMEIATGFPLERIRADEGFSILRGTSGALMGLLRLYEQCNRRAVLEKAIACGDHLLENRMEKWGYEVWDTNWNSEVESCSTGMGHGVAGISYALYRLYAHTYRERYRDAARDGIEFENVFYSEYEGNWKSNWTRPPHYSSWWCFGRSGIGLSRLGSLKYVESPQLRRDLDRAKRFEPKAISSDTLCHGTFSQVEFLVELGRKFDGSYSVKARKLTTGAIEERRETGSYGVVLGDVDGIYNPGLFLGTAGIGYTILRLLRPDEIPSILRFE